MTTPNYDYAVAIVCKGNHKRPVKIALACHAHRTAAERSLMEVFGSYREAAWVFADPGSRITITGGNGKYIGGTLHLPTPGREPVWRNAALRPTTTIDDDDWRARFECPFCHTTVTLRGQNVVRFLEGLRHAGFEDDVSLQGMAARDWTNM